MNWSITRGTRVIAAVCLFAVPAQPLNAQSTSIITVAEAVNAFLRSLWVAPRGEYMLHPIQAFSDADSVSVKRHGDDVLPITRAGIASVMTDEEVQNCKEPYISCLNRDRSLLRLSAVQRDSTGTWITFDLRSWIPPPPAADAAAVRAWESCCRTITGITGVLELRQIGGHWSVVRLGQWIQYP